MANYFWSVVYVGMLGAAPFLMIQIILETMIVVINFENDILIMVIVRRDMCNPLVQSRELVKFWNCHIFGIPYLIYLFHTKAFHH